MTRAESLSLASRRNRPAALLLALCCVGLVLASRPASAGLGRSAASVASDQLQMQGSLRTTAMPGYVLHEIETPTGGVVREFSSPAGSVFGVAWEGPFLPDFPLVLGAAYGSYVQAERVKRRGRGPLLLQLRDLVFESAGHQRGFHGRAYLPQLLPDGVPAEAVR